MAKPVDDLRLATEYMGEMLASRLAIPEANTDAGAAALALLRAMLLHSQALLTMAGAAHAEAGSANLRALFEAWIQLEYLLTSPDPNEEGRRYTVFALLEFLAYMHEQEFEAADIAGVEAEMEPFRRYHAELVASVKRQREGREQGRTSRYWTGLKPTALVRHVEAKLGDKAELTRFYKYASWDAHHVLTPALDIRIVHDAHGMRLEISPRQPAAEAAEFNCHLASRMMGRAWTDTAKVLQLARLSGPSDRWQIVLG